MKSPDWNKKDKRKETWLYTDLEDTKENLWEDREECRLRICKM